MCNLQNTKEIKKIQWNQWLFSMHPFVLHPARCSGSDMTELPGALKWKPEGQRNWRQDRVEWKLILGYKVLARRGNIQNQSLLGMKRRSLQFILQLMTSKYITNKHNTWLLNVCCVFVWKWLTPLCKKHLVKFVFSQTSDPIQIYLLNNQTPWKFKQDNHVAP